MQQEQENHREFRDRDDSPIASYEELQATKRITFADIREHLSGPVISIILHVFLIVFLATIIVIKKPEEPKESIAIMRKIEIPKVKKIKKIKPVKVETKEDVKIQRPNVDAKPVDVIIDDVPFKNTEIQIKMPTVLKVNPTNSAKLIPTLYNHRGPKQRKEKLDEYKAPRGTEEAVLKGLRWLKANQNPDGSWGDSSKNDFAAYTGMALLAFLAHGETLSSAEFGPTVRKAIKKLCEMVGPEADKVPGGYRHAVAMYALSEAYGLTKLPILKDVVNKGTARIIAGMNSDGSFDYKYKKGGRSDLSVAGWNYQALKAAFSAGCTAEGLEDAIDRAVKNGLKKTHYDSERQMFCYGAGSGPKSTMTAVGVLCLQLYGEGKSNEAKSGLETLESPDNFWFSWKDNPTSENPPAWALYQWYYQTQAIFQGTNGKGKTWNKWNKMFSSELIRRQKKDGRWETPAFEHNPAQAGHGEAKFKGLDQPVYATSLCCLMLEVYYRYLPTFNVPKVNIDDTEDGANGNKDDDLGLSLENAL